MFPAVLELRFESTSYSVNESAGSLEICLEVFDSAEIAPSVSVDVYIVEVSDEPLGIY